MNIQSVSLFTIGRLTYVAISFSAAVIMSRRIESSSTSGLVIIHSGYVIFLSDDISKSVADHKQWYHRGRRLANTDGNTLV